MRNATARLHRFLALSLVVLLTVMLTVFGLPVSGAAAAKIQVSVDGQNWSDRMPRKLFDSIDRIAPGDSMQDRLWLKNATNSPIDVRVQLRWAGPDTPTDLDDVLTVGMNGQSTTVGKLRTEPITVDLGQLDSQETAELNAETALPLSADNSTQREALQLDLVVQLSGEDEPTPSPTDEPTDEPTPGPTSGPSDEPSQEPGPTSSQQPPDDDDGSRSPLPRTGASLAAVLTIGALCSIGGASAIIASRRGNNESDTRK